MSDDPRVFGCEHVTEADDPQWMHDRSREHVREMVAQHLYDAGLVPLDGIVVTTEPFTLAEDDRALVRYRARAVGVPATPSDPANGP